MSLTIDYVTMPPKSLEASHQQTSEMNKLHHEMQQVENQFQADIKKQSEQTVRRAKAENEELKNEERRGKKRQGKKRDGSGKRDAEEEKKEAGARYAVSDGHFDMRV